MQQEWQDFRDDGDFRKNFKIDVPANFNFGFDCVDELAQTDGGRIALKWDSDWGGARDWTFAEIKAYSDGAARYFRSLGIKKGDRVMLIMKRRVHFWFALLGLIKIGAIAIPATHHLTPEDIVYRNNAASVDAIVTADDEKILLAVGQAQSRSPSVRHLIRIGETAAAPRQNGQNGQDRQDRQGWHELDAGIQAHLDGLPLPRVTKNDDMMLLYFTSGTTGHPKMALHNQIYPLAHIITAKYWHNLHPGSIHLTIADTGWAKAMWGKLFGQWLCKATVFVYDHDQLSAHRLLSMMAKHRVTSFCAPPTGYRLLLGADFSQYDLSALEYATSAGEPLTPPLYEAFLARTGLRIFECYGQTETVPIIFVPPFADPRPGSIGKSNPLYKVVFLDKDGTRLSGPGTGEICLDAAPGDLGVFMGYYQNDDLTATVWRDGLYHTGDLAEIDDEGNVAFIGRADDIIKSAGYRIGPFEVESVIQQHEAVLECAVTGVPDPLRGQAVKASIILRRGFQAAEELRNEIRTFIRANTAPYKVPRIIEFVKELPKTISGKIRRAAVRYSSKDTPIHE